MNELQELMGYDFFVNALIAALLISISGGIIGTYIVSRRMVFLVGGVTHASFGGIGLGHFFAFSPVAGAMIFGLLSSFGIQWMGERKQLRTDTAIGILWSFGMALGIILIYLTLGYTPNLMSYLFGNILMVGSADLVFMLILDIVILLFFITWYNHILYLSFDENFAGLKGTPVRFLNYFLNGIAAITVIVAIKLIGLVLLISFFTIPQAVAGMMTQKFWKIMLFSVIISFVGAVSGLFFSYYANIPSGAGIVCCFTVFFIVMFVISKLRKGNSL